MPPNIAVQVTAALAESGRVSAFRGRGEAFQQTRQLAAPDGWVVGRRCRHIVRICDQKQQGYIALGSRIGYPHAASCRAFTAYGAMGMVR